MLFAGGIMSTQLKPTNTEKKDKDRVTLLPVQNLFLSSKTFIKLPVQGKNIFVLDKYRDRRCQSINSIPWKVPR